MSVLIIEVTGASDKARMKLGKNLALALSELGYTVHHEDVGWKNQQKVPVSEKSRSKDVQIMMYRSLFD